MTCSRCGREHSGVCGIPSIGVRIGIGGVGIGGQRAGSRSDAYPLNTSSRPKSKPRRKLSHRTLEDILAWGEANEKMVMAVLKALPFELPEYDAALASLEKLQATLTIIRQQLASRKGR